MFWKVVNVHLMKFNDDKATQAMFTQTFKVLILINSSWWEFFISKVRKNNLTWSSFKLMQETPSTHKNVFSCGNLDITVHPHIFSHFYKRPHRIDTCISVFIQLLLHTFFNSLHTIQVLALCLHKLLYLTFSCPQTSVVSLSSQRFAKKKCWKKRPA